MQAKHGFLFLSCRPHQMAARVERDDLLEMLSAAVRCLTYAHIVRGEKGWMAAYSREVGRRPCGKEAARWRNAAQCEWTAATHANYAWMCLTTDALRVRAGTAVLGYTKRLVEWFLNNVPFPNPTEVTLPTPFPPPPTMGAGDTGTSLKESARAARAFYREYVKRVRGDS